MSGPFQGKTILVLGGSGSIGLPIVSELLRQGAAVHAAYTHTASKSNFDDLLTGGFASQLSLVRINVTALTFFDIMFDGIVYAVGDCPPGGFPEAIDRPLSELPRAALKSMLDLHVYGLQNACQILLPLMKQSGSIVALTSAITRLNDHTCPPWLFAGHYATAIAAQDELIRWYRRDPAIKKKGIWFHRIAPAAVDTPFHEDSPPDRRPPALLPISKVVDSVVAALLTKHCHVDQTLTPEPPT